MQKKQEKTPKDVKLRSVTCSFLDSTMNSEDRTSITRLAKSLEDSDGNCPHVYTVEKFMLDFKAIQPLAPIIKVITNKEGNKVKEIYKIEHPDITYKKEMRTDITNLKNRQDFIVEELKKLTRAVETLTSQLKDN